MCGIWTYIQFYQDKKNLYKILSDFWNIQNRGPDNSILETYNNVSIGFHRLAIMDNSFKSNQPFIFQNNLRTIMFVCNGEIYNFKELIEEYDLDIENNSDCMTIPKLYLKLDRDIDKFVKLFNKKIKGEFAFVLYEFDNLKNLRKLIIGRDQIGIRPLYCSNINDANKSLLLSSEIKGMKSYEGEVKEYPPGNIYNFTFDEFGNKKLKTYDFKWIYNVEEEPIYEENMLEKILLENLRNAIINSVRRRLKADRPLAFLLSGGVDSSLVCGIAAKILKYPINTFCCGMKGGTDFKYSKMVADYIKSNHTEVFFEPETGLKSIPDVISSIESWDTTTVRASVGQYLVSKYIGEKTDCRVVLVGEGPDEVCSSYMFNWNAPNGKELHKVAKEYVDNIHYYDCKRSDRCISCFGLEGRVPLLDPEVIEAYWKIPAIWRHPKYKGIEKWWLRKAFDGMNIIPDEVLWRKKEAFSDGVSSKEKSWFEIIQENIDNIIDDSVNLDLTNPTKEAYFYRKVFIELFGKNRLNIIPGFWQPRWCNNKGYVDPSARVLEVYDCNNIIGVVN